MKIRGISKSAKFLAIFEFTEDGNVKVYSGDDYYVITKEQYKAIRSNPLTSTHLMIKRDKKDDLLKTLSMRKQYKALIMETDILHQILMVESIDIRHHQERRQHYLYF
jgi:hypothetical protein